MARNLQVEAFDRLNVDIDRIDNRIDAIYNKINEIDNRITAINKQIVEIFTKKIKNENQTLLDCLEAQKDELNNEKKELNAKKDPLLEKLFSHLKIAKWVWSDSEDHLLLKCFNDGSNWTEYNHGRVIHVFTEVPTENRGDGVLIYDEDRHLYGYITKKRTFFGELSISKLNENINNKSKHKWFPKGYWEVSPSKCEDNQSSSDEDEENSEVDGSHSLLDLVDCSNAIVRMPIAHNSKNFSSKYISILLNSINVYFDCFD